MFRRPTESRNSLILTPKNRQSTAKQETIKQPIFFEGGGHTLVQVMYCLCAMFFCSGCFDLGAVVFELLSGNEHVTEQQHSQRPAGAEGVLMVGFAFHSTLMNTGKLGRR